MAAENARDVRDNVELITRFNEAAAHGRGKRTERPTPRPGAPRFNEAAAHGRGKLDRVALAERRAAALQ